MYLSDAVMSLKGDASGFLGRDGVSLRQDPLGGSVPAPQTEMLPRPTIQEDGAIRNKRSCWKVSGPVGGLGPLTTAHRGTVAVVHLDRHRPAGLASLGLERILRVCALQQWYGPGRRGTGGRHLRQ